MNGYQFSQYFHMNEATSPATSTEKTRADSRRMLWFAALYFSSLSMMVSIGASMRLFLTYM